MDARLLARTSSDIFSQAMIKRFLPGRLTDFMGLYEQPKGRKEIRQDNYVIEDYLKDITVTAGFDKKVVAGPADAIPVFQQQMNILPCCCRKTG